MERKYYFIDHKMEDAQDQMALATAVNEQAKEGFRLLSAAPYRTGDSVWVFVVMERTSG